MEGLRSLSNDKNKEFIIDTGIILVSPVYNYIMSQKNKAITFATVDHIVIKEK